MHYRNQDLSSKKRRKQVAPELLNLFSVQQMSACPTPRKLTAAGKCRVTLTLGRQQERVKCALK